jgi:EmrB/QacA subfamily drug resistance transporter
MGRVMSVIGVPMLLAPVAGPVAGGAIIAAVSWRWIFFINLPVGAAALVAAIRLLPDARPHLKQRLDVRGLALLSPGIAAFLYGMSQAGSQGGFTGPGSGIPALSGLVLIGLYIVHAAIRRTGALIDISLLRRRGFAAAAALNLLLMAGLFGSLILIPLYYEVVRHAGTLQTGLLIAPEGIGAAIALSLAGPLTDKIGARVVVTTGIALAVVGGLAFTQVGAHTSYAYLAGALAVIGLGLGATVTPSMAAAFQVLSRAETPRGTSALNAIQRIAGAVGTAVFAILLQDSITAKLPGHAGGVQAMSVLARRPADAAGLASAFGAVFWVSTALVAAALIPALLLPRSSRSHQVH